MAKGAGADPLAGILIGIGAAVAAGLLGLGIAAAMRGPVGDRRFRCPECYNYFNMRAGLNERYLFCKCPYCKLNVQAEQM